MALHIDIVIEQIKDIYLEALESEHKALLKENWKLRKKFTKLILEDIKNN